jgi:isoleucyl-tRNA synthetase
MSTMMEHRPPMKVLFGHALVRDERGEPMSKSKGNAIEFNEAADKMGADVMRWLYCRHNPAQNVNFGCGPAEEIRSKFVLKLWNTYVFFCNYARLDHFDPNAPPVPVSERPDIDRWILSDLQKLIRTAREAFESYDVMAFCLEAERFVDDKLSNWYVRRNRRRFWKSEQGPDKLAAYQTLYAVLVTLAKLFAPVMPFLTEAMYQNLMVLPVKDAGSVHLGDFPEENKALIDADLSADMEALLRLVSLGSAARNSVKIKVRQPLAEVRVQPADERDRRAVERFASQVCEELNVKKVSVVDPSQGRIRKVKGQLNLQTLGPRFGQRLKDVQAAFDQVDPILLEKRSKTSQPLQISVSDEIVTLEPSDFGIQLVPLDGWSGVMVSERGTEVVVDARITKALAQEGMARDVVRQVQDVRKKSGLEMEDRIALRLATHSETLRQAIEAHQVYISSETLATQLIRPDAESAEVELFVLAGNEHTAHVKVDGQPLVIQLRKVVPAP